LPEVGEFRGGLGLTKSYIVHVPCMFISTFDRTQCPPWGLNGGHSALPGNVLVFSADGSTKSALKENIQLDAGDRVLVETGGGGGFGDPRSRSPEQLRDDGGGICLKESAREVYRGSTEP
jgi:N-methylhydantoinase B